MPGNEDEQRTLLKIEGDASGAKRAAHPEVSRRSLYYWQRAYTEGGLAAPGEELAALTDRGLIRPRRPFDRG